jgi:outer membrane protein assembly factor BamB
MNDAEAKPAAKAEPSSPKLEFVREHKLPAPVLGFDVAEGASRFYCACLDGHVYEVDAETGKFASLGKHESYASSVHRVPGTKLLVSGGYDGALRWYDLDTRKTLRQVIAHKFWSWQTAVSLDGKLLASVTGQYQCGGYKYEPAPETEPSVKLFNAQTGDLLHSLSHVPPVQSVAFSADGKHLAAGNLMGEVRIWDTATGKQLASFTTPSFTGWGIIKGHYYTGGIYAMRFSPGGDQLLVCGMGSTTDPAAGNGKQLWQRFAWKESPAKKIAEAKDDQIGRGLMEALAYHSTAKYFAMAGRLFNGKWNTALFDVASGELLHSLDAKMRVTHTAFRADGAQLFLAGTTDQGKKKDGKAPESGRIKVYVVS